jgi:TonB family protein
MIAATLFLAVAHLIVPRLRRRSAAERHLIWMFVLAGAAITPFLAIVLPIADRPWLPAWTAILAAPLARFTGTDAELVVRVTGIEGPAHSFGDWLRIGWVAGAICCAAVLSRHLISLRHAARRSVRVCDERVLACASVAARRTGLSRPTRLLVTQQLVIPATWGVWRPRVVLPATVTTWGDEVITTVLAHEFAHARRGDWITHMLGRMVCVVFWFHPLFWTALRALERESEHAADDLVIASGVEQTDYADCLIQIVRGSHQEWHGQASLTMGRRSDLSARVVGVLAVGVNRGAPTRSRAVIGGVMAMLTSYVAATLTVPVWATQVSIAAASLPAALRMGVEHGETARPPVEDIRVVDAAGRDVVAPRVLEYTTPPLYSADAKQHRIEGTVTVRVNVDATGAVAVPRVTRALGHGLDENALVAVRHWRFSPAREYGLPVAVIADVDVEFTLRHEVLNELMANDMATQVGPGVTPPRVVRTVTPTLPFHTSGRVVLDVVLQEDGTPRVVRVLQTAGPQVDEAAVAAVERWRFRPAMRDGRPVKVRMTTEMDIHG